MNARGYFLYAVFAVLAVTALVTLSGCGGGSSDGGSGVISFPDTGIVPTPTPTPSPTPLPIIFKDWGTAQNQMPMDFTSYTFDTPERLLWYQSTDGLGLVGGNEIRRCLVDITISGTDTDGTLTISNAQTVWTILSPQIDTTCEGYDGTWPYSVTEQGLVIDGGTYSEVSP